VNIAVFFFWQPFGAGALAEIEFLYQRAAIPCELMQGRPITGIEVAVERCVEQPSTAALYPAKNVWLAVLTSMFLHANIVHLAGNMWFLWIFGDNVEDRFGRLLFIGIFVAAGVAGTVWFAGSRPTETVPIIGASGAIAGVLGAYLVLFPMRPVLSLLGFFLIPVPAALFIGLWFLGQFVIVDPGVAWEAHVGGFVAGVLLAWLLRPVARRAASRRQSTRESRR